MIQDLAHAFKEIVKDPEIRCVILTGRGRAFSAGIDLTDPPDAASQASDEIQCLEQNPTYWMSKVTVPILGEAPICQSLSLDLHLFDD